MLHPNCEYICPKVGYGGTITVIVDDSERDIDGISNVL